MDVGHGSSRTERALLLLITLQLIQLSITMPNNERSKHVTQGVARSANRAMYYAMGYQDEDFDKPMIGVANGHSTITPCNAGLQQLADAAIAETQECGANAQVFGTPTVSDAISMGTEGMKYSLVSREVIADSIETCVLGQWMDGVLVIGGCDKNMPGGVDGDRTLQCPCNLRLRRDGEARTLQRQRPDDRLVVRSSGRVQGGPTERKRLQGNRASLRAGLGIVRRHVYREHNELVI